MIFQPNITYPWGSTCPLLGLFLGGHHGHLDSSPLHNAPLRQVQTKCRSFLAISTLIHRRLAWETWRFGLEILVCIFELKLPGKRNRKSVWIACNCTFFELLILFQGPTFIFQTHSLLFLYGHWWLHYSLAVVMLGSCLHDKDRGTNKKHPKMEFVELMLMFSSAWKSLPPENHQKNPVKRLRH